MFKSGLTWLVLGLSGVAACGEAGPTQGATREGTTATATATATPAATAARPATSGATAVASTGTGTTSSPSATTEPSGAPSAVTATTETASASPVAAKGMFEGPTDLQGQRTLYGGLSLIAPSDWVDHGSSPPQGDVWLRTKDNSAGVKLWTTKGKAVIPTPGFHEERCGYLTYMATAVIANGKLRWDEPTKAKVGMDGVDALVTHGVGPTGKDDWEVYCIRAKVGDNDVLAVVGWNREKGAAFADTLTGLVKSWQ